MFHSFRALEGLAIKDAEHNGIVGKYDRQAFSSLRHRRQTEWNNNPCISRLIDLDSRDVHRNDLLDKRNGLFHPLQGFQPEDLFDAWHGDVTTWKEMVLNCLNFITQDDLPKLFVSREEASIMSKVHQALGNAIEDLYLLSSRP